jgi:hypothetical protein
MQSNQSGQPKPCSQPQPHGVWNKVVFAGHAKSMTAHCAVPPQATTDARNGSHNQAFMSANLAAD